MNIKDTTHDQTSISRRDRDQGQQREIRRAVLAECRALGADADEARHGGEQGAGGYRSCREGCWFPGQMPTHAATWWTSPNTVMSSPSSARSTAATSGPTPGICCKRAWAAA